MRLEHLCDMELVYQEAPGIGQKVLMIRPYGGQEGSAYGEGDGTVTGPQLKGKLRWVNHPHSRSDGVMLPNTHGVIRTDDGATILFSLQGRTVSGKQLLLTTFESGDKEYLWLNQAMCVLEGVIDAKRLAMQARVYICKHELK